MTTVAAIRKLEIRAGGLERSAGKVISLVRYCPDCEPRRYFVGGEEWSEPELERALEEQQELGAPVGVVIFRPFTIGACDTCGYKNYPDYDPNR
jgi:hypothetical protein